jgi:hypothetical protein
MSLTTDAYKVENNLIYGKDIGNFSFNHRIQSNSGALPVSYLNSSTGCFPGNGDKSMTLTIHVYLMPSLKCVELYLSDFYTLSCCDTSGQYTCLSWSFLLMLTFIITLRHSVTYWTMGASFGCS